MLHVYQMVPDRLGFLRSVAVFGGTPIGRSFGALCSAQDAYNIGVVRSWWSSTDTDCTLFHVKFEGGSFISILRKRATFFEKKIGVQNR